MVRPGPGLAMMAVIAMVGAGCSGGGGGGGGGGANEVLVSGSAASTAGGNLDQYVTLIFTPGSGGAPVTTQTDLNGMYSVMLPPDTYDLDGSRPGYDDYNEQGLVVDPVGTLGVNVSLTPMPPNEYIGSEDCGVCHENKFDTFRRSGHPYKINRVENGMAPTYPYTDISNVISLIDDDDTDPMDPKAGTDNTLGTPQSWFDVSYVIGGFGWKARFMDQDGYIVTGSEVQWNFFTGAMSAYHNNETDKKFNCGNCHTTGWRHFDAALNPNNQLGRVGVDGTFALEGIQCESCHGAGSTHAQTLAMLDITKIATPRTTADFLAPDMAYGKAVACGECHTRDGEKDYPSYMSAFDNARIAAGRPTLPMGGRINASGGMIRHHEQYDEILGIDPTDPQLESVRSAGFMATHGDCNSCHTNHTTTVYQDVSGDAPGIHTDCTTCHANKVITTGGMQNLDCMDCHMPLLAKSATLTFDPPVGDDRPPLGDIYTHVFRIDLTKDPDTEQFTATGSHAMPYVTGKWACQTCHSMSGPSFPIGFPSTMTIHN